jgi:nitroreductase
MSPLETLLSRKSHNKLISPAPSKSQVETMMQAALRAPDHAQLKPWRYQVFTGSALTQLGEHFVVASLFVNPDLTADKIKKIRNKPLRAPMIIVASVNLVEHKKVPQVEQMLSAGASAQNLIMAAHFMKIGAIWRTGDLAFSRKLMDELGLTKNESIVGFIYLGQEEGTKKPVPLVEQADFVEWK